MKIQSLVALLLLASPDLAAFGQSAQPCKKNISFAVARAGRTSTETPGFVQKWIDKNQKKYREVCFSQSPLPQTDNFVVVLATSQAAFSGVYPTVRRDTSSNLIPINGSGTVSDTYGATWNYTSTGTIAATTTTTTYANVPYQDTTQYLYAYGYSANGALVTKRWRTTTTRQGGDGANTLGYNLGTLLVSIGVKERLLKDVVGDLAR